MKFSLARPALVLAAALSLASCGGGGKATFPVNVTVTNLTEPGLVLSTNGQDVTVAPPVAPVTSVKFTFPQPLDYGTEYAVVPKGGSVSGLTLVTPGTQPPHQTCAPNTEYPNNLLPTGTAGQLANIQIFYNCTINSYALTGTITGLTADGLTLTNGSDNGISTGVNAPGVGAPVTVAANSTTFSMIAVPYNKAYGVSVLTQPTGLTCTVTGGNGSANNGSGIMDDAAAKAGGVSSLVVTCVPKT